MMVCCNVTDFFNPYMEILFPFYLLVGKSWVQRQLQLHAWYVFGCSTLLKHTNLDACLRLYPLEPSLTHTHT